LIMSAIPSEMSDCFNMVSTLLKLRWIYPDFEVPKISRGGALMPVAHSASGLVIIMLSGMLTASFPLPMKFARAWRWENTWLVYATFALIVIPLSLAVWTMPDLVSFYTALSPRILLPPLLFGFGWGIAQVTFGLSIARVGMAMAFAIVVGLSSLLGSMIPLAIFHPQAIAGRPGVTLLASAVLLAWGVVLYAQAGRERDREASGAGSSKRGFMIGLLLCIFTGCFGSMINIGFVFGGKIAEHAVLRGISSGRATLFVWVVVLAAGYLPNLAYTLYLLKHNRSFGEFRRRTLLEFLLALAAASLWLFGFLGYGVGADAMGAYGSSIGFAACMTVLLLGSTALGIFTGEWRGAPRRALFRMRIGVGLITASMLTLGFGSLSF
jgi:L-rhamnose-H+ transport protein